MARSVQKHGLQILDCYEEYFSMNDDGFDIGIPCQNFEFQDCQLRFNEHDNRTLIKRPQTASPYVMGVKYRNKTKISSRKTNRATITRRRIGRRRDSIIESEYGIESFQTNTSVTDLFDEFHDDFYLDELDAFDDLNMPKQPEIKHVWRDFEDSFESTFLESCSPYQGLNNNIKNDDHDFKVSNDQISHCENQYKRMCKLLNIIPISSFIRELPTRKVTVRHRCLCSDGAKAIAVALLENPTVQSLDMTDNEIGPVGARYIADMLSDNRIVTDLNLSENKLGIEGVQHIITIAVDVDNFTSLNLSGNGLREFDAIHIRKLFEDTHNLLRLSLSHNEFREFAGRVIGDCLKINDTIEELDLSWNHLRFSGADGIANGLALNHGLRKLDISWNGFSIRGCESLAKALQFNHSLLELNLECNRINREALEKLLKGLKMNRSLQVLKIGWNPITSKGAQSILVFINDNPESGLNRVDIRTQRVEEEFSEKVKKLKEEKNITIIHGSVRKVNGSGEDDDELSLIDENPILVLMEFGHMNGFRLTDLFAVFDKDGSKSLDKTEIKTGLMMAGIPLQEKCLEILIDRLDDDDSGEIEFSEMMQAQMIHKKQKAKMRKDVESKKVDIEKTEVGRVRNKLQKLMSKQMDGNPAFKRRVEEFKQMMASSQKDDMLQKEFEKKMALRNEKAKTREMKKAKEDAMLEIIQTDMQDTKINSDVHENAAVTGKDRKNITPMTSPRSWVALHT